VPGRDPHKRRGQSREDLAPGIAERDGIVAGLICVLAGVEPSSSFSIFHNKAACRLGWSDAASTRLTSTATTCTLTWALPARLQSWSPFEVQAWVNCREALSRALEDTCRPVADFVELGAITGVRP